LVSEDDIAEVKGAGLDSSVLGKWAAEGERGGDLAKHAGGCIAKDRRRSATEPHTARCEWRGSGQAGHVPFHAAKAWYLGWGLFTGPELSTRPGPGFGLFLFCYENYQWYVSYRSRFGEWYEFFLAIRWMKIEGCYLFEGTPKELKK
jgi:hypothetical protein